MAKDKRTAGLNDFDSPLRKTSGTPAEIDTTDLDQGLVRPTSAGLTQGTIDALDAIGAEYECSRGALMKLAIRLFLIDYRAGNIDVDQYFREPPPPKKKLVLPK